MNGNLFQRAGMASLALALLSAFGLGAAEVRADGRQRRQARPAVHKARRPSCATPQRSLMRTPRQAQPIRSHHGRRVTQPRHGYREVRYAPPTPRRRDNHIYRQPQPRRAFNYSTPRCYEPTVRYVDPRVRYREPTVYVQPTVRYTEPTVYVQPTSYVEPGYCGGAAGYVQPTSYVEPGWYGGAAGYVEPAPVVTAYSYDAPRYYVEPTVVRRAHRVPTCEVRQVYRKPSCRDWSAGVSLSWGKSRCEPHRGWHGWRPHRSYRSDRHHGGFHIRLGR